MSIYPQTKTTHTHTIGATTIIIIITTSCLLYSLPSLPPLTLTPATPTPLHITQNTIPVKFFYTHLTRMSSLLDTFYKTIQALRSDATSAAVFVATVVVTCSLFFWLTKDPPLPTKPHTRDEDPEPPRNFTLAQLKEFVGKIEDKEAPIYLALDGEVYDVSEGRDFYGPEGVYGSFAGHDVTKAFAKNSLEESDLDVEE